MGALSLALAGGVRPAVAERPAFAAGWGEPGLALEERVERTRSAALELGVRNVEPAARALLVSPPPEGELEATIAAVRLAPDLPAAHMGLALAHARELNLMAAVSATIDAARALPRNLEASLWLYGSAAWVGGASLAWGSILFLVLTAAVSARHAAHDLGDRLSVHTPDFARAALLGAVLLLPAALGEGLLGLALASAAVVGIYGSRAQLVGAGLASLALVAGLHGLLPQAARAIGAYAADPVAVSAHAAERGLASPMQLARLARVDGSDPLASRALAMGMKRRGDLPAAHAHYARLLAETPGDPVLMNNAANVRLALGDTDGAIALYRKALERRETAVTWFNLSQAWGVALNVVELGKALERAQEIDGLLVQDLSEIQGRAIHFVADLPAPSRLLRARLLAASDGGAVARDLRRPLAPGVLAATPLATGVAFALAAILGRIVGGRFRASGACERCGALVCPRCHKASVRTVCESCHRLLHNPEGTDRAMRVARAEALRRRAEQTAGLRRAVSLLVPGAAGLLANRPFLAWLACTTAAAALATLAAARGVVPDPLAAGAAGPALFGAAALVAVLAYLLLLGAGLAAQRAD